MLEINPPLVILTAVVFLALIAILNPLLYKPMLKFIDDRNESIRRDEESVSKNINDLSVYETEIQAIISNARNEANKIKNDALIAAKQLAQDSIATKRASLELEYDEFMKNLNIQKDELKESLISKIPELRNTLDSKLTRI